MWIERRERGVWLAGDEGTRVAKRGQGKLTKAIESKTRVVCRKKDEKGQRTRTRTTAGRSATVEGHQRDAKGASVEHCSPHRVR